MPHEASGSLAPPFRRNAVSGLPHGRSLPSLGPRPLDTSRDVLHPTVVSGSDQLRFAVARPAGRSGMVRRTNTRTLLALGASEAYLAWVRKKFTGN